MQIAMRFLLVALLFFGCSAKEQDSTKPSVVATSYAIYDAARFIARDAIDVSMLLPPGKEVHTFYPTPQDIIKLQKADRILYSGAGLEPWVKRFEFGAKGVDLSRYVKLRKLTDNTDHHAHYDPHYWLDFENQARVAEAIAKIFKEMLPSHAKEFAKRKEAYVAMLKQLDASYKKQLSSCKLRSIYVNHNAYGYLGARYGFEVRSVSGISPDASPSPKHIEAILRGIASEGVRVLFYEPFESSRVLDAIARDSNIGIKRLQPLANITKDELDRGMDYRQIALENLQKLARALECNGTR